MAKLYLGECHLYNEQGGNLGTSSVPQSVKIFLIALHTVVESQCNISQICFNNPLAALLSTGEQQSIEVSTLCMLKLSRTEFGNETSST